jgi:hypothetical protein
MSDAGEVSSAVVAYERVAILGEIGRLGGEIKASLQRIHVYDLVDTAMIGQALVLSK